jgi:oxygen-dependent protoporphyrinogen oxidase
MTVFKDSIIIGGGLSGLVAAQRLYALAPDRSVLVIEKNGRTGGVIQSFSENGFHAELGPHGFLDNCAESRDLLAETGLDGECVKASLATFVRYVCIGGRLQMIPQSPLKIIRAPLIPWKDKFRVLGDLFRPALDGEPTVAKWAAHRFGSALLPYVDAVFTGTYAGDYNELKIDAVMPGVRELERRHGSVIRGAIAKARAARKEKSGTKLEMPAMTSFPEGMERLPQRLTQLLEEREALLVGTEATLLEQTAEGWNVHTSGDTYQARNVILALPVNQGLALLTPIDSAPPVQTIPEAWINTVVFGFEQASLPPGFGFLIPEVENRFTLGTLFSSNMFPNRAPEGHIVIETLVGGRRHPERLELDDEQLQQHALNDVRALLDLPEKPVYGRVLRPAGGIPQLGKGYIELLSWRNQLVQRYPGLYVCGFGWEGIGLNDMIKTARTVAEKVIAGTPQYQDQAEVKKVYF